MRYAILSVAFLAATQAAPVNTNSVKQLSNEAQLNAGTVADDVKRGVSIPNTSALTKDASVYTGGAVTNKRGSSGVSGVSLPDTSDLTKDVNLNSVTKLEKGVKRGVDGVSVPNTSDLTKDVKLNSVTKLTKGVKRGVDGISVPSTPDLTKGVETSDITDDVKRGVDGVSGVDTSNIAGVNIAKTASDAESELGIRGTADLTSVDSLLDKVLAKVGAILDGDLPAAKKVEQILDQVTGVADLKRSLGPNAVLKLVESTLSDLEKELGVPKDIQSTLNSVLATVKSLLAEVEAALGLTSGLDAEVTVLLQQVKATLIEIEYDIGLDIPLNSILAKVRTAVTKLVNKLERTVKRDATDGALDEVESLAKSIEKEVDVSDLDVSTVKSLLKEVNSLLAELEAENVDSTVVSLLKEIKAELSSLEDALGLGLDLGSLITSLLNEVTKLLNEVEKDL